MQLNCWLPLHTVLAPSGAFAVAGAAARRGGVPGRHCAGVLCAHSRVAEARVRVGHSPSVLGGPRRVLPILQQVRARRLVSWS